MDACEAARSGAPHISSCQGLSIGWNDCDCHETNLVSGCMIKEDLTSFTDVKIGKLSYYVIRWTIREIVYSLPYSFDALSRLST
jgi:hypothetical protein